MQASFQSSKAIVQRKLNMKENFAEVVNLISTVDASAVEKQVVDWMQARSIADEVDLLAFKEKTGFDSHVYCDKTGNKLFTVSDQSLQQVLQTHGETRAFELVSQMQQNKIDPNWLFTDGIALEQLSKTDPVGYFVYAASCILRCYQPYFQTKHLQKSISCPKCEHSFRYQNTIIETNPDANSLWRRDKVKCNQALQQNTNIELLVEINELMRRYLSITKTLSAINQVKFTITKLQDLPQNLSKFKREIVTSIEAIIEHEYRKNKIKTHLTYADVINLNLKYEGHSNFRKQKQLKGMTEIDEIMLVIDQHTPQMKSIQRLAKLNEFEERVKQLNQKQTIIKHKGGPISLKLQPKKASPVKLSLGQMLRQKKRG